MLDRNREGCAGCRDECYGPRLYATFGRSFSHCQMRFSKAFQSKPKIRIVDVHAEATSEKVAMGWYLDGRVSAVVGTHTHVQTADERLLPHGTAYLTDIGMTGSYAGVIGMSKSDVIARFTSVPAKRAEHASWASSNLRGCNR